MLLRQSSCHNHVRSRITWNGSSACIHHWLPSRGRYAESFTSSSIPSINLMRIWNDICREGRTHTKKKHHVVTHPCPPCSSRKLSSWGRTLSLPNRLARWILIQFKPSFPSGFFSANCRRVSFKNAPSAPIERGAAPRPAGVGGSFFKEKEKHDLSLLGSTAPPPGPSVRWLQLAVGQASWTL